MQDPINMIANVLNKGGCVDPAVIDNLRNQCTMSIHNNLRVMQTLDQVKAHISQFQQQQEVPQMNSFFSSGMSTPKASNMYAPKPLHVTSRVDSTRIGRSHSMYVPNPIKPDVSTGDKSNGSDKHSEVVSQNSDKKQLSDAANIRKRMNVFRCPHKDRKHYAKNMCNNCYHKQGRNKKATKCPHKERQNYAKGKCQNCYLNDYHKVKRRMKKQSKLEAEKEEEEEVDRRISVETSSTEVNQDSKIPAEAITQK